MATYEQARADAAYTAAALERAWERPGAPADNTRADGACACGGGGHTDAARSANTFKVQDRKGRVHVFDANLWTPAAAAESLDALERVEARCGTNPSPGYCRG
jgi:hypothetical protein